MAKEMSVVKNEIHITWVVDVREGEPDVLAPVKMESLEIRELSGLVLWRQEAPAVGWTVETLYAVKPDGEPGIAADAFLGGQWIGSTEV